MGLDVIVSLAGMAFPSIFDFIKKKFLKPETDTIEATVNTLATSKPEVIASYLSSVVEKIKADILWFNRDVIGAPSFWVVDLRAAIRPITVIVGLAALIADMIWKFGMDPGTRMFLEMNISNWFGSRLVTKD